MASAPAVVVHGLTAALAAALAADVARGLVLLSAPGAGLYAGAGWFAALARQAAAGRPELRVLPVLDCADAPGAALAAMRAGLPAIVFTGNEASAGTLSAIAEECGAVILRKAPPALDLAEFRPGDAHWWRRLAEWLAGPAG